MSLGLTQHCRALSTMATAATASREQEGKTLRPHPMDGTMLASAAATSGLPWGRSGFLGWPATTQHRNYPVLWTSVSCAWELLVSKVQLTEGLMEVSKAQRGGDGVSHWKV